MAFIMHLFWGVDFLSAHDTVVRFSNSNTLHIPDQYGENNVCVITTEKSYARTRCPILISLRCDMNIPVHISRHQNGDIALLEPHKDLQSLNLTAARCCVQVDCDNAFLRVIYPNFETVELPMHFVVADVIDVDH